MHVDAVKLEQAYFNTRVIPRKQHEAVVKLLSIFAQHLSMLSNQVVLQQDNAEPPVIARAKEYIRSTRPKTCGLGTWPKPLTPAPSTSARCSRR